MRALILVIAALAALPAASRDLGMMPFSGQLAFEWIAREDDGKGGFTARYRLRGGTDEAIGGEMLLGGFGLACQGTLHVVAEELLADDVSCRLSDTHGNGAWLDLRGRQGGWRWHGMDGRVGDGSGIYARLRGEVSLIRTMHMGPETSSPWGFFSGTVRWRLE
jgi:hypothetical protein